MLLIPEYTIGVPIHESDFLLEENYEIGFSFHGQEFESTKTDGN